ncbi:unnamed protein product [Caenorhabditis bovis]|uniref:Membrane-associated protein n=1 Tax=Caenorhabditis bovis TaxID=2654633 RepID=A0A8S1FG96_9PELO|nr:unnamed protein product [Caenorhabditis bovis]
MSHFLAACELPFSILIALFFITENSYIVIENALRIVPDLELSIPFLNVLVIAFAVISIFGAFSKKRHMVVFTLVFNLFAFIYAMFNLFHVVHYVVNQMSHHQCHELSKQLRLSESQCWIADIVLVLNALQCVLATAIASMAVYQRLTSVVLPISDRNIATRRSALPLIAEPNVPRLTAQNRVRSPLRSVEKTDEPLTDLYRGALEMTFSHQMRQLVVLLALTILDATALSRVKRQCCNAATSSCCGPPTAFCVPICMARCQSSCTTPLCSSQCSNQCHQQCSTVTVLTPSCSSCQQACATACTTPSCIQTCQTNSCASLCANVNPCQSSCQAKCLQICTTPSCSTTCSNSCNNACSTNSNPIVIVLPSTSGRSCQNSCQNQCAIACTTPVCRQTCQSTCLASCSCSGNSCAAPITTTTTAVSACEKGCVNTCTNSCQATSTAQICLPACRQTCRSTCNNASTLVIPCVPTGSRCTCAVGYSKCGPQCCRV